MANIKTNSSKGNRAGTEVNPAGMTFEQYLKAVGYKALVFPSFEQWLKNLFDYNKNGTIDKGSEKRNYKKAVNNTGKNTEYLSNYEHEKASAMAQDEATVENLRILWYSGNMEEGAAQAARDAQNKADNGYISESGLNNKKLLIVAAVIMAAIVLISKK